MNTWNRKGIGRKTEHNPFKFKYRYERVGSIEYYECKDCGEMKSVTEYYTSLDSFTGARHRRAKCKECHKKYKGMTPAQILKTLKNVT